jgi:ParB-like chromosome segregation protein Spo0J
MKPDGTEDFILIDQIVVTEEFLNSHPSVDKTQQVLNYVKKTGFLDEPIMINRDTKILTDGYRRYIAAKEMKMNLVPIVYEK